MTTPTLLLSLLARDVLSQAREQLATHPTLTLWLACCCAADDLESDGQRGLDELYEQLTDAQEDLSGADAADEITTLLQRSGYPDTVPAPAPTLPSVPPPLEVLLAAERTLAAAHVQVSKAREQLAGHEGYEDRALHLQMDLESFVCEVHVALGWITAAAELAPDPEPEASAELHIQPTTYMDLSWVTSVVR